MTAMQAFQPAPPAAISRVLEAFDRVQLEGFIEVAIGLLDLADGDPDREEDDDAGQTNEDEVSCLPHGVWAASGPGCPIGDSDTCSLERYGEATTIESFTQGIGSAVSDHNDDDEGHFVPVEWPVEV